MNATITIRWIYFLIFAIAFAAGAAAAYIPMEKRLAVAVSIADTNSHSLQNEIKKDDDLAAANARLSRQAEINGWPKVFECTMALRQANEANQSWQQWGQKVQAQLAAQQQGRQMTPQDMQNLLAILKLLL